MSTVHVIDVCRALWHLASHGDSGDVFNLADKSETSKDSFMEYCIFSQPLQVIFKLHPFNSDYS